MKFIEPSFEILGSDNCLKSIELAARTCYMSQDKITEDESSAKKMVTSLVNRGHYAMLEFGNNISMFIETRDMFDIMRYLSGYSTFKALQITPVHEGFVVSMNPRTAIEYLSIMDKMDFNITLQNFYNTILDNLPFEIKGERERKERNQFNLENFQTDVIHLLDKEDQDFHKTVTVRIVTNRGVTHELVRHKFCVAI